MLMTHGMEKWVLGAFRIIEFIGQMPVRGRYWSFALSIACGYRNSGGAAPLELPESAEKHMALYNLALFLDGYGNLSLS